MIPLLLARTPKVCDSLAIEGQDILNVSMRSRSSHRWIETKDQFYPWALPFHGESAILCEEEMKKAQGLPVTFVTMDKRNLGLCGSVGQGSACLATAMTQQ